MNSIFRGARLLMALVLILTVAVSCFVLPGFNRALMILALGALAFAAWFPYLGGIARKRFSWRDFWASELGAVTVTYYARSGIPGGNVLINGSTTVPTSIQASNLPLLRALVQFGADTDVQALITHNWGLDASAVTYFDPEVLLGGCVNSLGVNTSLQPNFSFDFTNTNVVKVNKASFVGTNCNYLFILRRPVGGFM